MCGALFWAPGQPGIINGLVAILLTGMVIKIMDDFLDKELDACAGRVTLASRLQGGAVPYLLLLLAVAIYLAPAPALSLFLSAYIVGMMGDGGRRLPTGLSPVQESLLVLVLGVCLCGWQQQLSSLLVMAFVQAVDDLVDLAGDQEFGAVPSNLAARFGKVETTLFAAACLLAAVLLDWGKTAAVIAAAGAVLTMTRFGEKRQPPAGGAINQAENCKGDE